MSEPTTIENADHKVSITSLLDTRLKKFGFIAFIASQVAILGSPFIGGMIGSTLGFSLHITGSIVFVVWIVGEALFFSSILILGKPLVSLCVSKFKAVFKRRTTASRISATQ